VSATQVNAWPIFKGLPASFLIAAKPFAKQLGWGLVLFVCAKLVLKFLEASEDRLHVARLVGYTTSSKVPSAHWVLSTVVPSKLGQG
jgi:hypothetical protein